MINIVEIKQLDVDNNILLGVKIPLNEHASILVILGKKGHLVCGYFDMNVATKFDFAVAQVSGVESFDDTLNANVKAVTPKAKELGVEIGMSGREAAKKFA